MGAVVSVTSESSSSESEESETKSLSSESSDDSDADSDRLENWMILGRENQDGDQSISLNLEGVCVSGSGGSPLCLGSLFFCSGGFVFLCDSVGPILIYLQHIDKERA